MILKVPDSVKDKKQPSKGIGLFTCQIFMSMSLSSSLSVRKNSHAADCSRGKLYEENPAYKWAHHTNTDVKLWAVSLCLAWDVWIVMQGFLVNVLGYLL